MNVCKTCGSAETREETVDEIAARLNKDMERYNQSRRGMADAYWRQLLSDLNIK